MEEDEIMSTEDIACERYVQVTDSTGSPWRLPIRYFRIGGICLDYVPVQWTHNSEIALIITFFSEGKVCVLKTKARVVINRIRGGGVEFDKGSDAYEWSKRLVHTRVVDNIFMMQMPIPPTLANVVGH